MFFKRTRGYFRASYSLADRRAAFLFWIPKPLARTWCVLRVTEKAGLVSCCQQRDQGAGACGAVLRPLTALGAACILALPW